jgi:hypothetical protein
LRDKLIKKRHAGQQKIICFAEDRLATFLPMAKDDAPLKGASLQNAGPLFCSTFKFMSSLLSALRLVLFIK